ncbi:MAG TPA: hypothetical protein VEA37_10260 [Flavobacterium sp.]|nr:hypothetical protein [Flavobacterium sp.]
MKKIFLLLSAISTLAVTSCGNDDDYVDYDTYPEVFDVTDVDFVPEAETGRYAAYVPLEPAIFSSDVVLVYRETVDDGTVVWQPIPRTLYLDNGEEVDYDFNFTQNDVLLFMGSTYDLAETPQFTQNQVFRIVLVPGWVAQSLDTNDYNAVMSAMEEQNGPVQIETLK